MKSLLIFFSLFIFVSCISINDDIALHEDGSGTFKYVINLSMSKVKVNSYLALDSLDGKKVPSITEIKLNIAEFKEALQKKEGISNVKVDTDFENFILKFQCDFASVQSLQKAIKETINEFDKKQEIKETNAQWLSWDGKKLTRTLPAFTQQTIKKLKQDDIEQLKQGKYISVTRFDKVIEKVDNQEAQLNPAKNACMIKTTPHQILYNSKILDNIIFLKE